VSSKSAYVFSAPNQVKYCGFPSASSCDPWPNHPRWVVTYVLLMATLEFGHPVALVILVVSGDCSLHEHTLLAYVGGGSRSKYRGDPHELTRHSGFPSS
jgi:hypothetical protein